MRELSVLFVMNDFANFILQKMKKRNWSSK